MRVLVLAGGDFAPAVLDGLALDGVAVVCVDRGLEHALGAGLEPALLVGDLDSVAPEALARAAPESLPRLVFAADKDESDLALALDALADGTSALGVPDSVIVAGVSGGRTDHLLFNWLLPAIRPWPFALTFVDATVEAHVVSAERPLSVPATPGRTFSLLPLGRVSGVVTGGLRYALAGATLGAGTTLGLSNVVADARVSVSVGSGVLLALAGRATPDTSGERR